MPMQRTRATMLCTILAVVCSTIHGFIEPTEHVSRFPPLEYLGPGPDPEAAHSTLPFLTIY
jgi:hypothetical protein